MGAEDSGRDRRLASRFAQLDPYRATDVHSWRHHERHRRRRARKPAMISAQAEAGAHAYAARSGRYAPLAVWRRDGEDLVGELELLPLRLGTVVAGTLRVHPTARLALEIARASESADELAMVSGQRLAWLSNLSALRALATEGIQRGHMSLHARSVASAAGALGDEVELVAARIADRA